MKKILIPAVIMGVLALSMGVQAETMTGKVVSKQNDKIQVMNETTNTPTTLKTTPNTTYYTKKRITNENMSSPESALQNDELVEIIYIIDPTTNDLIIEEIVIWED